MADDFHTTGVITTSQPVVDYVSSETEWDAQKSRISQLYLDEDKPLKDVMTAMLQKHAFRASVKMYKTHITRWGFDKKNKESEIFAIVRKKAERAAVGKPTSFLLRGRPYDFGNAERYLKRKKMSVADAIQQSAPSPPALRCLTPESVPRLLTNAASYELPDRIVKLIRNYVQGSYDNRTWVEGGDGEDHKWVSTKARDGAHELFEMCGNLAFASDLFFSGAYQRAGKVTVTAFAGMREIVDEESPRLIGDIADNISVMLARGQQGLAFILLKQLSAIADTVLKPSHPLAQIFGHLASMDMTQINDLIFTAWESFLDVSEKFRGRDENVLVDRLAYIHEVSRTTNDDRTEPRLRVMAKEYSHAHGYSNVGYADILFELARLLYSQARYAEAYEMAQNIIDYTQRADFTPPRLAVTRRCEAMWMSSLCQFKLGEFETAELSLRGLIELEVAKWGWHNPFVLQELTKLEEWLIGWDRAEEAAEVGELISEQLRETDAFV